MIVVSDHALLRYIQRIHRIDIEVIRAEIAAAVSHAGDAPCVRALNARFLIRNQVVVTTLEIRPYPPHWDALADLQNNRKRR